MYKIKNQKSDYRKIYQKNQQKFCVFFNSKPIFQAFELKTLSHYPNTPNIPIPTPFFWWFRPESEWLFFVICKHQSPNWRSGWAKLAPGLPPKRRISLKAIFTPETQKEIFAHFNPDSMKSSCVTMCTSWPPRCHQVKPTSKSLHCIWAPTGELFSEH